MGRVRGVVLASALLGGLATACSFILDVEGPPVPVPPAEDAGPLVEAGEEDAPPAEPDADVPEAEAPDAADAGDAGTTFCQRAGTLRLCDDFERADAAADAASSTWSGVSTDPGGAVVVATEPANHFLRTTVGATQERGRAVLFRTFPTAPATRLRFAAAMRVSALPESAVGTMSVVLGTAPNARALSIFGGPGVTTLVEWNLATDTIFETSLPAPIPTGRFARVELRVAFDVAPPRVDVLVDGDLVLSQASQSGLVAAPPTFAAGVSYAKPTPAYEVDLDDVIADFD